LVCHGRQGAPLTERDATIALLQSTLEGLAIAVQQSEEARRESEARFRTLAETAPCAIFIYQDARIVYANAALEAMSGYSRSELEAMSFWQMVHPDFKERVLDRGLARPGREGVAPSYELKIVRKDRQELWVSFSASTIDHAGEATGLGTAFDITERKRTEDRVRNLAYHDSLTGLPNRRLFNDRLSVALAQAHRHRQPLAVLFLDVDRFKVINDSLGHEVGDRLLQRIALRLISCVREGDTVARLGGDEFILLLPGLGRPEDVARVADKVLDALRRPFPVGDRELQVSASMGVSVYPGDGEDVETLIRNADVAMYRAKERGRDNFQAYTPGMNATASERLALESRLRDALEREELLLHFQPMVDVMSGRVMGVEALLRWQHPERGLLLPEAFLSTAEVTGIIVPIGHWVLRTACDRVRAWQGDGHRLDLSVNLSSRQLHQPDLVDQVGRALAETGLPPESLHLEVTETSAMRSADTVAETLRQLKELGVGLAMDDFGVGYSSLSHLKRLSLDSLKIDQSFVRDIADDADNAAIASAVIALGHTLGLQVTAEGVETAAQLAFLSARRCDRAQGWLLSPPLPAEDVPPFLARGPRGASRAD
jgi:diguanylate cyclase (GGDEF)-like protein/PAS domain S-box-containing protein